MRAGDKILTLDRAVALWTDSMRNCTAKSRATYRWSLSAWNNWLIVNRHYNAMGATRSDVLDYEQEMEGRLSPYTIASRITALRKFYGFLQQEHIRDENIASRIRTPRRSMFFNKLPLSDQQVCQLFASVDRSTERGKRDYAILMLMIYAGLRCCEVANLAAEDVITRQTPPLLRLQRKGHRSKDVIISIRRDVADAIAEYGRARRWKTHDAMMIGYAVNHRGRPLDARGVAQVVRKLLDCAGVAGDKISPHSLRHTYGCAMVAAGVEMQEIQYMMGHSSLDITAIYTRMQKERELRKNNPSERIKIEGLDG